MVAKVEIGTGSQGFTMNKVLPSPHVAVINGVSFYIGTLPQSACTYSYLVIDTTSPSASAEHNIGFGTTVLVRDTRSRTTPVTPARAEPANWIH